MAKEKKSSNASPPEEKTGFKAYLATWSPQFKEFVLYLLFLILFCFVIFAPRNADPYFMQKGIEDTFTKNEFAYNVDFQHISSREQVIQWVDDILLPQLYPQESYSGQPLTGVDKRFIGQGFNKMLGKARFRALRVKPDSCNVPEQLEGKIKECFAPFSADSEDTTDISYNGTGYNFVADYEDYTESPWMSPTTKLTYGSGGQVFLLDNSLENATMAWEAAKQSDFLSHGLRALFINVNLYNANVDLVSAARFTIEFSAAGALYTSAQIRCMPLIRPTRVMAGDGASAHASGVWTLELVFFAMVLVYVAVEIVVARRTRGYFKSVWNQLEVVNLILFLSVIVMRLLSVAEITTKYEEFSNENSYLNLDSVVYFAKQVENVNSFNAVLSFLKLFKFARENKKLSQFIDTLEIASVDMVSILIIIAIISTGYGIAFHIAFGHAVTEYRDFSESLFTLFLATLGDFDMDELRSYNQVLGAFLFVSFIVIMFFIIISMFLAIVDSAYEVVRESLSDLSDEPDPLTRDILRVLSGPARLASLIHQIFAGKDAMISHEDKEDKRKKQQEEDDKREKEEKEKRMTPESLERQAKIEMEHEFKKLYDEAMGRIEALTTTQDTLQSVLNKIGANMDIMTGEKLAREGEGGEKGVEVVEGEKIGVEEQPGGNEAAQGAGE